MLGSSLCFMATALLLSQGKHRGPTASGLRVGHTALPRIVQQCGRASGLVSAGGALRARLARSSATILDCAATVAAACRTRGACPHAALKAHSLHVVARAASRGARP